MKKLIVIYILLSGMNAGAQIKLERLYTNPSITFIGPNGVLRMLSFGGDLSLMSNFNSKYAAGIGYSGWGIHEATNFEGLIFPTKFITSGYEVYYTKFGGYKKLSKRINLQYLGGISYNVSDKAYNFRKSDKSNTYNTIWDYDRKVSRDLGVTMSTECVVHFARVTGVVFGVDAHFCKSFSKLNFRFGIPLGYFKKINKTAAAE